MLETVLKAAAHLLAGVASVAAPDLYRSHQASCAPSAQHGSSQQNFSVKWAYYEGTSANSALVVIMPPTGGATVLDRWYAKKLCQAGQSAVILESWTGDDDLASDVERHNRHFARSLQAISFMAQTYDRPLRLLGTSVGGLYALSALMRLPAVEKAVLITAGAPFSGIVVDSEHEDLARVRQVRMSDLQLPDHAAYRQLMDQVMQEWTSMQQLTPELGQKKPTLVVVGLEDTIVPTPYQVDLAKRLQPSKLFSFQANHFWTIVRTYWKLSDQIVDFLRAD
jgi:pimeloyl-ACP methyl ester carboxylesterase